MHVRESLAELQSSSFDTFLHSVTQRLREALAADELELPDGVGEFAAPRGRVEFAVCRPQQFAALRWQEGDTGLETFFVTPEGMLAQCGIRLQPSTPELTASPVQWFDALRQGGSLKEPRKPLPNFLQLVALLASSGHVQLPASEPLAETQELRRELDYLKDLSDDQGEELRHLRARVRDLSKLAMRSSLSDAEGPRVAIAEDVADLSGLPDWAKANEDRIVVLPRALNGAKKSLYLRPELVYRGLEYLAGAYRDYRLNRIGREDADKVLLEAGLRVAGSAAPTVAGEQGDAYFVSWNGRRRFLEFHLGKGGGRDERYCLRIYYFWDDESSRVVVGSLPAHLSNSLS